MTRYSSSNQRQILFSPLRSFTQNLIAGSSSCSMIGRGHRILSHFFRFGKRSFSDFPSDIRCQNVASFPFSIVTEVRCQIGCVCQEFLKIITRGIIKSEARRLAELRVKVLEFAFKFGVSFKDLTFGRCQEAINPSQYCDRKNNVLIFTTLECVTD
jgi:hypothetical protein